MSEMNELMQVVKQSAFNIQSVGEQMGIITSEVKSLKVQQLRMSEQMGALADRMQGYEDRIRVSRSEAQTIKRAIHARVIELLGIEFVDGCVADWCISDDKKYRGGFISRCYHDAREYSRLGTPYYETYHKDYLEVLEYINTWVPMRGVTGYKEYLDKRAEEIRERKKRIMS